jgi:hypothetical protein
MPPTHIRGMFQTARANATAINRSDVCMRMDHVRMVVPSVGRGTHAMKEVDLNRLARAVFCTSTMQIVAFEMAAVSTIATKTQLVNGVPAKMDSLFPRGIGQNAMVGFTASVLSISHPFVLSTLYI